MTSEQKTFQTISYLWQDFLAKVFQSLEKGKELKSIVDCFSIRLPELQRLKNLRCYSLKTSVDSSHPETEKILPSSFERWGSWGTYLNGVALTADFSMFRKTGKGCSLSDILENKVDAKYFLSSKETEKLCQRLDNGEEANTEVSYTIDANYHKGGGCESFLDKNRRQLVITNKEDYQ
jgi:hypothetical protein